MICGLETMPGFEDLIKQLPPEARKKRIGQRFPLVPELAAAEVPAKVESSVDSIASALFPSMVQTQFKLEGPGGEETDLVLKVNTQLFRFMTGILDKRERLAGLVRDCIPVLPAQPILFGGCYFAATGADSETQQAFASGVLTRMMKEDQNSVTWTEETLADDAAAWRRPCPQVVFLDGHRPSRSGRRWAHRQEFSGQGNRTDPPGQTKTPSADKKPSDDER